MDDYGYCRDCKNCDDEERNGYKWYCNRFGIYVDPDKWDDCSKREEK